MIQKTKKRLSIFQIMAFLLATASVVAFIINNIIAVNQLMDKNNELKENLNKAVQTNYSYQIDIERLTSFERIKALASLKFQMRLPDITKGESKSFIIEKSQF